MSTMYGRGFGRVAIIAALGVFCLAGWLSAGVVRTGDGKDLSGNIHVGDGKLQVETGGAVVEVALNNIRHASFVDAPGKKPSAPSSPDKKAEPTKPVAGLRGEYFADKEFKDLRLVRIDPLISFDWQDQAPDPQVPKRFSVRWTGQLEGTFSETFTFELDAWGPARMWIDGRLVLEYDQDRPGNVKGTADLKAGRKHDFKLEYQSHTNHGSAHLRWFSKRQERHHVRDKFFLPAGSAVPAIARFSQTMVNATPAIVESFARGLLLRNGCFIAGNIGVADETAVKMWPAGGNELVVPASQVARLVYRPLSADAAALLPSGRRGVLLSSGDFFEGSPTVRDGQIKVSSVIFGMRYFNSGDQTTAVVLHDPEKTDYVYQVRTQDGSVYKGNTVELKKDSLLLTDALGATWTVAAGRLMEITKK